MLGRLEKRQLYQDEGVPEYWVVDLEQRRVERSNRGASAPEMLTETLAWHPVAAAPQLTLNLVELFRGVWAGLDR